MVKFNIVKTFTCENVNLVKCFYVIVWKGENVKL